MAEHKMTVVGIGATGTVLAAALLSKYPDTLLVGRRSEFGKHIKEKGIRTTGAINCRAPVNNYVARISELKDHHPTLIFITTKTFHLEKVLEELKEVVEPDTKIVSTQNGLGTEDFIADAYGPQAVFRMSLNFGVSVKEPGEVQVAFFNKPNHLGSLTAQNRELGVQIAKLLTECDLDTEFVDDIKLYVWKKMIMKCTMASICAVTDKTIQEALEYPPTREIADACFNEALAVAKSAGYDLGQDYLKQALGYLEKVGAHKDSMCHDIENKTPTEIDFLGSKIVEYGRAKAVPTPFYVTMTNLVKAMEDNYLRD
jgi:2-dehydropantoate 2-reductase